MSIKSQSNAHNQQRQSQSEAGALDIKADDRADMRSKHTTNNKWNGKNKINRVIIYCMKNRRDDHREKYLNLRCGHGGTGR